MQDLQVTSPEDVSTLGSPSTRHMAKFALLCQAARLLGQILCHANNRSTADDEEWLQLHRTVQSMLTAALDVDESDHAHVGFVYR